MWPTSSGNRLTSASTKAAVASIRCRKPSTPVGLTEQIDASLQRTFDVVHLGQKCFGDKDPLVLQRDAQSQPVVVQPVQHHRYCDGIARGGDVGSVVARRGLGGEQDHLPARLEPPGDQRQREGKSFGVGFSERNSVTW